MHTRTNSIFSVLSKELRAGLGSITIGDMSKELRANSAGMKGIVGDTTIAGFSKGLGLALSSRGDTSGLLAGMKGIVGDTTSFSKGLGLALGSRGDTSGLLAGMKGIVGDTTIAGFSKDLGSRGDTSGLLAAMKGIVGDTTIAGFSKGLGLALGSRGDTDRALPVETAALVKRAEIVTAGDIQNAVPDSPGRPIESSEQSVPPMTAIPECAFCGAPLKILRKEIDNALRQMRLRVISVCECILNPDLWQAVARDLVQPTSDSPTKDFKRAHLTVFSGGREGDGVSQADLVLVHSLGSQPDD